MSSSQERPATGTIISDIFPSMGDQVSHYKKVAKEGEAQLEQVGPSLSVSHALSRVKSRGSHGHVSLGHAYGVRVFFVLPHVYD